MIFNWEDDGFRVEMINRRSRVTSSYEPQGSVLDALKAGDRSGRVIRVNDRSSKVE